jgi:hypothetical protein
MTGTEVGFISKSIYPVAKKSVEDHWLPFLKSM